MNDQEERDCFLECSICDLSFTSLKTYKQHVSGKNHKKREKLFMMLNPKSKLQGQAGEDSSENRPLDQEALFSCSLCEKSFSGKISYLQHLKSNPHHKQLARRDLMEKMEAKGLEEPSSSQTHPILAPPFATCEVCEKQFSGPESYQQHLESNKHKQQLSKENVLSTLKSKMLNKDEENENSDETYQLLENMNCEEFCALFDHLTVEELSAGATSTFECKQCEKSFSGYIPQIQHFLSPAHRRQIRKLEVLELAKTDENQEDIDSSSDEEPVLTCEMCETAFSGPESFLAHQRSKKHKRRLSLLKFMKRNRESSKPKGTTSAAHRETRAPTALKQADEEVRELEGSQANGEGAKSSNDDSRISPPLANPELEAHDTKDEGIQTEKKSSTLGKLKSAFQAGVEEL